MKICISAASGSLDAPIDPRFGRCVYFVIVDPDTMKYEAIPNEAMGAMGGAGIQAAQSAASKGVSAVITGQVGPNAFQVLSAAGIKIFTGAYGTVRSAIEMYKKGQLQESSGASVGAHFGMGMGGGRGMSRGGGRGMGRGGGRGMGMGPFGYEPQAPPPVMPPVEMPKEAETQMLENQMKMLESSLEQIKARLNELKK